MAVTGLRVWRVYLDQPGDPRWLGQLSDAERERAARLAGATIQRRYLVAHAALRAVLGRLCGVRGADLTFGTEAEGRPYLDLPGARPVPEFNLSHSGEWALVAVAPPRCRVGVDIQRIRQGLDYLPMARWMYDPAEFAHLLAVDPADCRAEFFRIWTAKEAYVKALGIGVAGMRDIVLRGIDGSARSTVHSRAGPDPGCPVHWLRIAPGYVAAAVVTAVPATAAAAAYLRPCA